MDRRQFLASCGASAAALAIPAGLAAAADSALPEQGAWDTVRAQFALDPSVIHMSALLIAAHPAPVRAAIERHRRGLDTDPVRYLHDNHDRLHDATVDAAADYLGTPRYGVALTDSTTMGIGLVYNGLRVGPEQEILTTDEDYYATHEALRLASKRTGCSLRRISLYDDAAQVSADEIVGRLIAAVRPDTRALALTWVHSSTGLKLPVRQIADALAGVNSERADDDRLLLCIDGVHGFGNQEAAFADLGCDFLFAGCHKWLFGPRGTGIVAASDHGWAAVTPTIPTFTDYSVWDAWLTDRAPEGRTAGRRMSPGGYKPFEHQWALAQAFEFHEAVGRAAIAARTAEFANRLKEGLAAMAGVTLRTPRAEELSAGIVSFDVNGWSPTEFVARLRRAGVIASAAPYAVSHVRLTPSIQNSPEDVERVLETVHALR